MITSYSKEVQIDLFDITNNTKNILFTQGSPVELKIALLNCSSEESLSSGDIVDAWVISYSRLDSLAVKTQVDRDDISTWITDTNKTGVKITSPLLTQDDNRCSIVLKISNGNNYIYTTQLFYNVNNNPVFE